MRVVLPYHLRTLARVEGEVELEVAKPVTVGSVLDALEAVPGHITAAATAMGYPSWRRFLAVELPLAVPVLSAGVRVASVSNISLVSVGALRWAVCDVAASSRPRRCHPAPSRAMTACRLDHCLAGR